MLWEISIFVVFNRKIGAVHIDRPPFLEKNYTQAYPFEISLNFNFSSSYPADILGRPIESGTD